MAALGAFRFPLVASTPSAPPSGYALLYIKTDEVLYLQDEFGVETPLGSSSAITSLTGEATGSGPGVATVTLSNSAVIGKVLTGFTSGPNSVVLATDTILQAIQKLQAQSSASIGAAITALTGDVSATGPGSVTATVNSVGGKSASDIAQSVTDTQAATSADVPNTIVKRDGFGSILVTQVNGVVVEAHASRHLPSGADPIATAAPVADLSATTTNAVGAANSLARSDHSHAIDTGVVSTQNADQSNAAGTSANLARADHVHNIPTAAPITDLTPNSTNSQGSALTFAKSDHSHAIDSGVAVTQVPDQSNAAGTAASFAKSDHVHNIPSATPVQIGTANARGAAASFALSDHVHNHGNQTNGALHAVVTTTVNGFMSATDKVKLDSVSGTVGTNAQILISDGTTYNPRTVSGDATITNAGAVTVASVGTSSAANIHSAELAANAATSANTASTIVKRDASGNFSAGVITASLTGNATNVTGIVAVANGGTGASTAPAARVNLNIDERTTFSNANYIILSTDRYVAQIGTLSAPRTVTLPAANSVNAGQLLFIADESGTANTTNTITITAAGADTINGAATKAIRSGFGDAYLVSNGSNSWFKPVTGIGSGGTGLSTAPTDGQLLIGQSSTSSYIQNTLTAGTGVTITNAGGSITIAANSVFPTLTKTANYTILSTDSIIFCDTSGGAFTLTLPDPSTLAGKVYRIIDTTGTFNANNLTLARHASEKIEGLAASKLFQTNWGGWQVITNGTDWYII